MTRCLLLAVLSFAPLAWAQDALDRPYDEVVELPLSDVPPPPVVSEGGQSAVAPSEASAEGDVPAALSDYEQARRNAERVLAQPRTEPSVQDSAALVEEAPSAAEALPASTPEVVVEVLPPIAEEQEPEPEVVEAESVEQTAPDAPVEVPLSEPVEEVTDPPGAKKPALPRRQTQDAPRAPFHPAPSAQEAQPGASQSPPASPESERHTDERWRDNPRRVQHTVFGERRHNRFLGAVVGVAHQPAVNGGLDGGALQLAARLGSSFRIGVETRGLWGAEGPTQARLVGTGLLLGTTFSTRRLVHPYVEGVFGGGVLRDSSGAVVGSVGTTVVRGGAELNVWKNIRLAASLGWGTVATVEPSIRHDLSGLEAAVALRFGWF